jgi:CDP-diacylglycerol--glycerol-3-phosphate 3-phosphatidyltransferase
VSRLGSKLDSIGDDLTVAAAIIGLFVLKQDFLKEQIIWVIILIALYVLETGLALIRYKKLSSFHTYTAKIAAVLQGTFLILVFFLKDPPLVLFYLAALVTIFDLAEEIILVILLPTWETDVRGLYWVLNRKKQKS